MKTHPFIPIVLILCAASVAAQGDDVPVEQVVEALIRDLAAERYDQREAATESLRRIGRPALGALEKAARSDDPEVRVRAQKILTDVRLGITADWPADLALRARHCDRLSPDKRRETLRQIAAELGDAAVPFLVARMGKKDAPEADAALGRLKALNSENVWRKVVEILDDPKTPQQTRALALARARLGMTLEALRILDTGRVDEGTRREMVEVGVKKFLEQLGEEKYEEVARDAAKFADAARTEARFLYLQAQALRALEQHERAEALEAKALTLVPDKEAPHFTAGEMLQKLDCSRLAFREWDLILKIPPKDEVYDINAHLRMTNVYRDHGLFTKAADALDAALAGYTKARAGGRGMGIIGGTEEDLRRKIAELRDLARRFPAPPGATVQSQARRGEINVHINVVVKDGKIKELQNELAAVAATLTVNVKPEGLRLFDVAPSGLQYDPEKKQIAVTLNDKPCVKPVPFNPKGDTARVAVVNLDCVYIFEIDTATGAATRVARFEKDFIVRLEPDKMLGELTDVVAKLNGRTYDWDKLREGLELDRLPRRMKIYLEGTTPRGRRISTRANVRVREPKIGPPPKNKPNQIDA